MKKEPLILEFDNKTIRHLGISLYSSLPPVIAELVANCYDANATQVNIEIHDSPIKKIIVEDNGDGMNYEDLRKKYLEIGRDRREGEQLALNFGREPIGRKGIGKLAGFGIAKKIFIETTKNFIFNKLEMDYDDILTTKDSKYMPKHLVDNKKTKQQNGSKITLVNLKRISPFNPDYPEILAIDLARRFNVFSEDFNVKITYNGASDNSIVVDNTKKFENLDIEFEWEIPLKDFISDYEYKNRIRGKIITTKGAINNKLKGIFLLSRGKLVNQKEFFDADNQDYAYTHMTGWLNIDFIENFDEDPISTNRESLNWELEETSKLRVYLSKLITTIKDDWRKRRKREKIENIKTKNNIDIEDWLNSINSKHEKKLAEKIVNVILESNNIESQKAGDLVRYVKNSFEFESFRYYASEMAEIEKISNEQLIKLLKEWQIIEAREIYNLAKVRIEAIKSLERHIDGNALEVSVLEKFFEKFPWILDPRIMEFKTEQRYSQILKEKFGEIDDLPEIDKRLDFLCINHLNQFFIIELKRPKSVVGAKFLNQGLEYVSFIEENIGNEYGSKVTCIIIGGKRSPNSTAKNLAKSLRDSNNVYFKPYNEVLSMAQTYHKEIIERYEQLEKRNRKDRIKNDNNN